MMPPRLVDEAWAPEKAAEGSSRLMGVEDARGDPPAACGYRRRDGLAVS